MTGNPLEVVGTARTEALVPHLYAPRLLKHYYERSILPAIANTNYEGQFAQKGDVIHIRKAAEISVRPWKDGDTVVYPEVASEEVEMKIDHAAIYSFKASLLKRKQSDLKGYEGQWLEDASKQIQKYTEITCLSKMLGRTLAEGNFGTHAGCDSEGYNLGTIDNPVVITPKETESGIVNATDFVSDIISVLSEQNVTNNGEQVSFVAPKIFRNRIAKSDFKRADIMGTANTTLRMGQKSVGKVYEADFYDTGYLRPLFNTAGRRVFPVLACTKDAISFALQFSHTWTKELEGQIAQGYRGLSVFGCELIEPKALAVGYVAFNS